MQVTDLGVQSTNENQQSDFILKEQEKANRHVVFSANENGVKFIRLWFTDILGNLKGFAITVDELEEVLNNGASFDGAVIKANARSDESDMIA